jgi:hypothetical protein
MEVDRMPELTDVNKRHVVVEMKLAEIAFKLRKAHTNELSLAPSMLTSLPSITTLMSRVGEGMQRWLEQQELITIWPP